MDARRSERGPQGGAGRGNQVARRRTEARRRIRAIVLRPQEEKRRIWRKKSARKWPLNATPEFSARLLSARDAALSPEPRADIATRKRKVARGPDTRNLRKREMSSRIASFAFDRSSTARAVRKR